MKASMIIDTLRLARRAPINTSINYLELLKSYKDLGLEFKNKHAYGIASSYGHSFRLFLSKLGFNLSFYYTGYSARFCIHAIKMIRENEAIIIGSNEPYVIDLVNYAVELKCKPYVFGFGVPDNVFKVADVLEIDEYYLRGRNVKVSPEELRGVSESTTGDNPI